MNIKQSMKTIKMYKAYLQYLHSYIKQSMKTVKTYKAYLQ